MGETTTHTITAPPEDIERECRKFLADNPQYDPHPIERGVEWVGGKPQRVRRVFGLKGGSKEGGMK